MWQSSARILKLRVVVLVVLALVYIAWAVVFIARSSTLASGGRYFCLFDDAMVSLRYAWNFAHGNGNPIPPGCSIVPEHVQPPSAALVQSTDAKPNPFSAPAA